MILFKNLPLESILPFFAVAGRLLDVKFRCVDSASFSVEPIVVLILKGLPILLSKKVVLCILRTRGELNIFGFYLKTFGVTSYL